MSCRICLESDGTLISPCACKGTAGYVHEKCLLKWIEESKSYECEICKVEYSRAETCGFSPTEYCSGCFRCKTNDDLHVFRISIIFFMWSAIIHSFVALSDYIVFSNILSAISLLTALFYYLKNSNVIFHNVWMHWETAVSLPAIIALFIYEISNADRCDMMCMETMNTCNSKCPLYHYYIEEENLVSYALMVEIGSICVVFGIRMIFLCCTHMRSLRFVNATEEELETLLDKRSSRSGGGNIGSDLSSSSGSFSDFDIEEAAINESTDNSA